MKKPKYKKRSLNFKLLAILPLSLSLILILIAVKQSQDYRNFAQSASNGAIQDFQFSPGTITVPVGTSFTWSNQGATAHTATSDMGGSPNSWDSGILTSGKTFTKTFTQAGTYAYHCNIHTFMKGTIVVTAAAPTVAPTAIPPTTVPPTNIPPTNVPPTAVPTAIMPTLPPTPTTQAFPSPGCLGSCPVPTVVGGVPTATPIPQPTTQPAVGVNNGGQNNGLVEILLAFIALILGLFEGLFR